MRSFITMSIKMYDDTKIRRFQKMFIKNGMLFQYVSGVKIIN